MFPFPDQHRKIRFKQFLPGERESRRFRNGPTIELATGRLFLPIVHLEILYTDGRCGSSENLVEFSRQASKVFKVVESKVQLLQFYTEVLSIFRRRDTSSQSRNAIRCLDISSSIGMRTLREGDIVARWEQ